VTTGSAPLASTIADDDDAVWYLNHQQRILTGLLDSTVTGCTHVRSADAIWAFAGGTAAYCPDCWPAQSLVPLADLRCDYCSTRQAATWMASSSPDEPLILVAAVCDPCETSRILDLPRPDRGDRGDVSHD
jgi:hypothetical protein